MATHYFVPLCWSQLSRGHRGLDGRPVAVTCSPAAARLAILAAADVPLPGDKPKHSTVGTDLFTLVHTYAHRVLRQTAVLAESIETHSASTSCRCISGSSLYAAARGDFVLGGLQALFETELNMLLDRIVEAEHRCPLDPGCTRGSGACSACLHVGEPSCRAFNTYLDRKVLFAETGYLRIRAVNERTTCQ